jgi:hypothetical protein
MKNAPFYRTLAVLTVALGLGAYAYFVDSKKEPKPDKPKEKVFTFDKKKVRELSLEPTTGEAVKLVRQGEAWTLTSPLSAPADATEVDAVLSSLEGMETEEVVAENASDFGQYGLATPRMALTVHVEGVAEPLALHVGDKAPDSRGLYARVPAKPRVFLIPAYLQGTLEKKPFDLRDRSVLHVKRDQVQRVDVGGPEGEYSLARSQGGEDWTVARPIETLAGRWAVDELLGQLESLNMDSVVEEEAKDLKPYGLDQPTRVLTLTLKDGGTRKLEIGNPTPEKKYHARDASSQRVVLIPPALVDDLAKGLGERRAKRLLEVAAYEVVGIEVEAEGGKRVYERSSSKGPDGADVYKWKRSAPDGKDVETNKVQDALFLVGGVEIQEFVDKPGDPASYGLQAPTLKATFKYEGARTPASFELGQKDGAYYARRTGDTAVLRIDPAKGAELVKSFKEL